MNITDIKIGKTYRDVCGDTFRVVGKDNVELGIKGSDRWTYRVEKWAKICVDEKKRHYMLCSAERLSEV